MRRLLYPFILVLLSCMCMAGIASSQQYFGHHPENPLHELKETVQDSVAQLFGKAYFKVFTAETVLERTEGYLQLGNCYLAADAFPEALANYRSGLALAQKANRKGLEAQFYAGITNAYFPQMLKQDSFIRYSLLLESGYIYYLNDPFARASNLNRLAGGYYNLKQYDKARYYWAANIAYIRSHDSLKFLAPNAWNNLAGFYHKTQKPDSEYYCLMQGLRLIDPKRPIDYATLYNSLGEYYQVQGQYDKALENFRLVLHYVKDLPPSLMDRRAEVLQLMAKAFTARHQYDSASWYNLSAAKRLDSVIEYRFSANTENDLLQKGFRYQANAIQKEAALAQKLKKSSEIRFAFALAFLLIFIVLTAVLFMLYQKLKRRNILIRRQKGVLREQKNQIGHSLKEKELLLSEIHHRVKNNLQVILSLLQLQAKDLTDAKAITVLQDVEARIRVINLIHQYLYQSDDLETLPWKTLSDRLITEATRLFTRQPVLVENHAPEVAFNMKTALSLCLILNELVSNSCKHAFKGQQAGTITTALEPPVTEGEFWHFRYTDSGPGMPANWEARRDGSLGVNLILNLARQIQGKSHYDAVNRQWVVAFKP